jgi:hypothetical protein
MAKIGRNELCSCGSGRKVKRCCGVSRGPSEQSLAWAFLRAAARDAVSSVRAVTDGEFAGLLDELVDLPAVDLALQVELPKLVSPALGRLFEAVAEDDQDAGEAVLDEVLGAIDMPLERARLARGVIARRAAGKLDDQLAATALIDLASGSRQLLCASLLEAVAVRVGAARTPAGIVLAA